MKNFLAVLIFAACGIGWFFYHEHTSAQKAIAELEVNLPHLEQTTALKRLESQAYERISQTSQNIRTKQAEIDAVRARESALQAEIISLRKDREKIIAQARSKYAGQVLPQLILQDGRQLTQVKIIRIDESGLSVAVPSGVQKIASSELPLELKKALFY